jgi:signal transduction histidine kinase
MDQSARDYRRHLKRVVNAVDEARMELEHLHELHHDEVSDCLQPVKVLLEIAEGRLNEWRSYHHEDEIRYKYLNANKAIEEME